MSMCYFPRPFLPTLYVCQGNEHNMIVKDTMDVITHAWAGANINSISPYKADAPVTHT